MTVGGTAASAIAAFSRELAAEFRLRAAEWMESHATTPNGDHYSRERAMLFLEVATVIDSAAKRATVVNAAESTP